MGDARVDFAVGGVLCKRWEFRRRGFTGEQRLAPRCLGHECCEPPDGVSECIPVNLGRVALRIDQWALVRIGRCQLHRALGRRLQADQCGCDVGAVERDGWVGWIHGRVRDESLHECTLCPQ